MENNKIILMNNKEMLLFCELMENEYNNRKNTNDKSSININNVLNKVFENE